VKCNCPIDHWLWVVGGLQGIKGMMENLDNAGIHASGEAINRLREHIKVLTEHLGRQVAHHEEKS
jgi:hypothetical protein